MKTLFRMLDCRVSDPKIRCGSLQGLNVAVIIKTGSTENGLKARVHATYVSYLQVYKQLLKKS